MKYRACVIGRTGRGGYGHGIENAFTQLADVRITAVADEDAAAGRAAAERVGAERTYDDYQEMLAVEKPELVAVAPRWMDVRREMIVACAEAGVIGIFCEKPLAVALDDADAMLAVCERAGTRVQMAHQLRVTPQIIRAHELLRSGQLGELISLHGRGKEDSRGGGEDMIVLGVHILNLMRWFAGDARWASARVAAQGRDARPEDVSQGTEPVGPVCGDNIVATWGFNRGVVGTFETRRDQAQDVGRMGLQIRASKGILQIASGSERTVHVLRKSLDLPHSPAEWTPIIDNDWLAIPPGERTGHDNRELARDLVAAVEEEREPICGIRDARAVTEMLTGVYASHIARARVEFPLPGSAHPLTEWRR